MCVVHVVVGHVTSTSCRVAPFHAMPCHASQTELETKIRGLQSREKHSSADLDMTREELKSIKKHQETAEAERAKVRRHLHPTHPRQPNLHAPKINNRG